MVSSFVFAGNIAPKEDGKETTLARYVQVVCHPRMSRRWLEVRIGVPLSVGPRWPTAYDRHVWQFAAKHRQPCRHRPFGNTVLGLFSGIYLCPAPRDGTRDDISEVGRRITHSVIASVWQACRMRWCGNGCEQRERLSQAAALYPL